MGGSLSRTIQGKFKTKANKVSDYILNDLVKERVFFQRDRSLIDESTGNGNIKKGRFESSASGRRY